LTTRTLLALALLATTSAAAMAGDALYIDKDGVVHIEKLRVKTIAGAESLEAATITGVASLDAKSITGVDTLDAKTITGVASLGAAKITGVGSLDAAKITGVGSLDAKTITGVQTLSAASITGVQSLGAREIKGVGLLQAQEINSGRLNAGVMTVGDKWTISADTVGAMTMSLPNPILKQPITVPLPAFNKSSVLRFANIEGASLDIIATKGRDALLLVDGRSWLSGGSVSSPAANTTPTYTWDRSASRLKRDIEALGTVGPRVDALRPVRYKWRELEHQPEGGGAQVGFIADDVQPLFPDLVETGPDGFLRLDYAHMTAVLAKGLQEARAELALARSQLAAERARIDALAARLETLERRTADAGSFGAEAPGIALD
jgi:hypothetical protein